MRDNLVKSFLLFFLCVVSGVLRNMKVAVLLSHPNMGAEVIPFIVVWGILPAVFIATAGIGKLAHTFGINRTFYLTSALFCLHLLLYAFLLAPLADHLQLPSFIPWIAPIDGMIQNWPHSLLYIVCDLWPILMINFLFWGAVNESATEEEAQNFYGLVKMGGCVAAIASGAIGEFFISDEWQQTVIQQGCMITVLTAIGCALFYWLASQGQMSELKGGNRLRLTLSDSLKTLAHSPYLIGLTLMVVGYNLAFSLPLTLFNKQLNTAFDDAGQILSYLNWLTVAVGVIATVSALSSRWITSRFGWITLASITPFIVALTSIGFFGALFIQDVALALFFGSLLNCLGKGSKYSVFDVSKEQAFVPLNKEMGWKGKAAVDALATPIGKTGSALLFQGIILATGSVNGALPLISSLVMGVIALWFFGIYTVGAAPYTAASQKSQ